MRIEKVHLETVELLLASITSRMGEDGLRSAFLFEKPGARFRGMGAATEIFFHSVELHLAAHFVRSNGPQYFKALPLSEIVAKLRNFVTENFWYLRDTMLTYEDTRPFNIKVGANAKSELAKALAADPMFHAERKTTLFPLATVQVSEEVRLENLFFTSPTRNNPFDLSNSDLASRLLPMQFPPVPNFTGRIELPTAWLGIRSPDVRVARKMRAAVLGALALTQPHRCRYMFSGRRVFGGQCTIEREAISYSFEPAHTPPCFYDVIVSAADSEWLEVLSRKLSSSKAKDLRHIKALEYFYRSWEQSPEERFPIYCMALDAIFGDANHATQAVVEGVANTLGIRDQEKRLRDLMGIRASVIHGGAPDVYESSKYPKYFRKHGFDPIIDLELVTSECIRSVAFNGSLTEHPDPNEPMMQKARESGRFPQRVVNHSILAAP